MNLTAVAIQQDTNFAAEFGLPAVTSHFAPKQRLYLQGSHADSVFYLLSGTARLAVRSDEGKEASVMNINSGEFLGEDSLVNRLGVRTATAIAITPCVALEIDRDRMLQAIRQQPRMAATFMSSLLLRGVRAKDAVVDQFFNSSERRLARILLIMAKDGLRRAASALIPRITQEALAEMVGTTRSRVSFFLNRFRKLGFIDYGSRIRVFQSLSKVLRTA